MNKQEKLAELHSIRTTLDKVTKNYCTSNEERKTVEEISLRLFTEQIVPLAEELTAQLVKDTKKLVTDASGVQLIDLGLPSGTKWADRNVGANTPEEYGDYFRWGETTPLTPDSPEYEYENFGENIAGTEHDAATMNLGEGYKMPTIEQIRELVEHCTREWTKVNGVNGMKVTGPNGNSIFLPAAGWSDAGEVYYVGYYGYYWSASPNNEYYGRYLYFYSSGWYCNYYYRTLGQCVRPVSE